MLALFGYDASMLDARQIAEILRMRDGDPEVSQSTLHYYVQVGILPPAVGRGRGGYTPEHLSRFRLARRLKREGMSLAGIRTRLAGMSVQEVTAELGAARPAPTPAYVSREPAAPTPGEPRAAAAAYSMAAEALGNPPGTPRTLRFRGGYSLQVPAGTPDERVARLYSAIEAVLNEEKEL